VFVQDDRLNIGAVRRDPVDASNVVLVSGHEVNPLRDRIVPGGVPMPDRANI
jgi:hypothetical protein